MPETERERTTERAVQALYAADAEREWCRLERHRTEFAVTLRALEQHLPAAPAQILDCGGGPGRYAIALAQRGYHVTLFDLSPDLLSMARQRAADAGVVLVGLDQGTATDLTRYPDAKFDAVLLMGPLYHLLDGDDRHKALAEACRVTKPGGVVFAAFIARYAAHIDALAGYPDLPTSDPGQLAEYQQIASSGLLPPRTDGQVAFTAYFAHPNEVRPLCESAGLDLIELLAAEGLASGRDDKLNALEGNAWDFWVDVNATVSRDPSVLGGAEHLLAVCRRPRWRSVLKQIAATAAEHKLDYRIVGGTALALRGLPVPVHDVDVEFPATAIDDAYRLERLLEGEIILQVSWRESESYRSHFGRMIVDGVAVEIMAGLERRVGEQWLPSFLTTDEVVWFEGLQVRTLALEEEVLAYLRAGRLDRAGTVLPHCKADRMRLLFSEAVRHGRL